MAQVAAASAVGADAVPRLRPTDCVPAQVCSVDDVDASLAPVAAKDAVQRGVPLGDVLYLSLVGGQLALIDFSPAAPTASGNALPSSAGPASGPPSKASLARGAGGAAGGGRPVLVLPLAWCCAIVESQRPFRLRVSSECDGSDADALVPVREMGLVLRDRGLCRAVASRLNEAALAARHVCRDALTRFLNTPLEA
jgi:hypothetical protein